LWKITLGTPKGGVRNFLPEILRVLKFLKVFPRNSVPGFLRGYLGKNFPKDSLGLAPRFFPILL